MGGNTSRKLRVDRMRRQLARDAQDTVWRTFDPDLSSLDDYREWLQHWHRLMKIKHGDNLKEFRVWQSEYQRNGVRYQLEAILWDPTRRPGSRARLRPSAASRLFEQGILSKEEITVDHTNFLDTLSRRRGSLG